MARVSRRELKEDQFISGFEDTLEFLEEQWEMIIALVLVVLVGAGALGGLWWQARRADQRASLAVSQALDIYSAPVRAPGESQTNLPGPSFATEKEKYEAAQKEFARLRQQLAGTRAAVIAKHYEALALWELGQRDETLRRLEEVSRAADPERAAIAGLHLAGFYQKLGRTEDARKLYRKLADHPTASVPRATALLGLADLLVVSNPAEARKLYQELKRSVSDATLLAQIDRRLEMLPPAR